MFTIPNRSAKPTTHRPLQRPNVCRAIEHADGLRRHLLALGLRGEAVAAEHILDELIPSRSRLS